MSDKENTLPTGCSIRLLAYRFIKVKKGIYASLITAVREKYKRALLALLFSLLHSFMFTASVFIRCFSTPIVLEHYSTVTTFILFVFRLRFLNDIFSSQRLLS
jgi:hypothetical protein